MKYEYEFIRHIEATSFKFFFISMMRRLYHWHSDIEILLVLDGSVMLETANNSYRLSKNDIFIINANEVHSFTKTEEPNTILAIQFDPKFCKGYFPQLQRIVFLDQSISEHNNNSCWTEMKKYLSLIVKDYYEKEKCCMLKIMSTLHLIVCCLLNYLNYEDTSEKELSSQQNNLNRLNRIILFVKENYMNKVSLKDIAEKENLDMYYLSHFIKKHLGISFQEYLQKVRLEKAIELLMTDRKRLDICIECGFSDYRYLNKIFLKELGCMPVEYKKLNKKPETPLTTYRDEQHEIIHSDKALEVLLQHLDNENK